MGNKGPKDINREHTQSEAMTKSNLENKLKCGPSLKINLTMESFLLCVGQETSDMSEITKQPKFEPKYKLLRGLV